MIGILIIAHDTLPESLVKAVTHVLGIRPAQFETLSVTIADDPLDLLPIARLSWGETAPNARFDSTDTPECHPD